MYFFDLKIFASMGRIVVVGYIVSHLDRADWLDHRGKHTSGW
jgi:hypothetical protein